MLRRIDQPTFPAGRTYQRGSRSDEHDRRGVGVLQNPPLSHLGPLSVDGDKCTSTQEHCTQSRGVSIPRVGDDSHEPVLRVHDGSEAVRELRYVIEKGARQFRVLILILIHIIGTVHEKKGRSRRQRFGYRPQRLVHPPVRLTPIALAVQRHTDRTSHPRTEPVRTALPCVRNGRDEAREQPGSLTFFGRTNPSVGFNFAR